MSTDQSLVGLWFFEKKEKEKSTVECRSLMCPNSGVSLATSKDCKDQLMQIIPLNELMIGESCAAYLQTER